MIRYIKLKNFRSFTYITFDLTERNGTPKPFFILYGENGSGKSNFVSGFDTLVQTFQAFSIRRTFVDLIEKDNLAEEDLISIKSHYDIGRIIHANKTVNSTDNMSIELGFSLKEKPGTYYIEFDNNQIVAEKLSYVLTKNKGSYFDLSALDSHKLNSTVFSTSFTNELNDKIDKFWGKFSLMSFLFDSEEEYTTSYLTSAYSETMGELLKFFKSINVSFTSERNSQFFPFTVGRQVGNLTVGNIKKRKLPILEQIQNTLNSYFTSLFRDIKEVYYKKTEIDDERIHYELFVRKVISEEILDVSFNNESQGTKTLLKLFQPLIHAASGQITIIDEIDNGIHDVLLKNLLNCILRNSIDGQLIVTTHNSLLIDEHELKDYIYFIDMDDNYRKEIKALTDYDFRIQSGTRILSNYLQERFARIPWTDLELDLKEYAKHFE